MIGNNNNMVLRLHGGGEMMMMSWSRVLRSSQAVGAHASLFTFTLFLVIKLDHHHSSTSTPTSWRIVFIPLWLFHAIVARGRCSLPAPITPHDRHWAPCHTIVAAPLLVSFELLLCIFLETSYVSGFPAVNLKIVFLPLLALEIVVLIDNFRMCRALMPGDEESVIDEAIWETLPHFWVAVSMVFFIAATTFTLLKLSGAVSAVGWWELFINYLIAECFAFLVCTKWSNPAIHRQAHRRGPSSSSQSATYLDWSSGLVVSNEDEEHQEGLCGLQNLGGHLIKIPLIAFQVLLCMHLEGTPRSAQQISVAALFLPIFLLQGTGLLLAISRLVEKLIILVRNRAATGRYFAISSRIHDCFGFLQHGSRLLGWWSIDESSKEEQARLYHAATTGYNTFCGHPPEVVKKMAIKDLAEEVWRLQAALGEQVQITKYSQQEFERLQSEKVICRVCFESEIAVVLLPCRHRGLCSNCSQKCKKCPICRVAIEECMPVFDV